MKDKLYFAISLLDNTGCGPNSSGSGCGIDSVKQIAFNLIRIGLYLAGVLAVIFIIVGGIQYVTSAGNPQANQKAKTTITYAVGGLVLSILAVSLVNIFINSLVK